MGISTCFSAISTKGNNFSDFLFNTLEFFLKGSTFKKKELLLEETFVSCKSCPLSIDKSGKKENCRVASLESVPIHLIFYNVQSTLVISTSVISNNRLSRRKNLVLVITQKSKIRYKILWKRGEIAPGGSNFSSFPQYFQYIFLFKGVKLHSHL